MSRVTSRRAILAGAAATVPALAIPSIAGIAAAGDPIYAAIERHKLLTMVMLEKVGVSGSLKSSDPAYESASDAFHEASDAATQADIELTNIVPATINGVIALLEYIDGYNRGELYLSATNRSCWMHWPDELVEEGVTNVNGKELSMPFAFWILRNVHEALQDFAAAGRGA